MKQVIIIRKDLKMRRGKEAAQASHAAMAFLLRDDIVKDMRFNQQTRTHMNLIKSFENAKEWFENGMAKIVVSVDSEAELLDIVQKAKAANLIVHTVTDASHTEFHDIPTLTCAAIGPNKKEEIDSITGHLKLL